MDRKIFSYLVVHAFLLSLQTAKKRNLGREVLEIFLTMILIVTYFVSPYAKYAKTLCAMHPARLSLYCVTLSAL